MVPMFRTRLAFTVTTGVHSNRRLGGWGRENIGAKYGGVQRPQNRRTAAAK